MPARHLLLLLALLGAMALAGAAGLVAAARSGAFDALPAAAGRPGE